MNANTFKQMILDLLDEKMTANEFKTCYLENFKKWNGVDVDEKSFELLNGVFESADCYYPDYEEPFEISEQQLRLEVRDAFIKLNNIHKA
ncbi:colicin immunity domain-containing protein [Peribacillus simplex]|uniref:colicin immunity domain-containing protein n=1 Tax=Peribacillus simplex TaxID=1478 RepID=UPI003D2B4826